LSRKIGEKVAQIFLPEFVQNGDPPEFAKKFLTFGRLSLIIGSVRRARELPGGGSAPCERGTRGKKSFQNPLTSPLKSAIIKTIQEGRAVNRLTATGPQKTFGKSKKALDKANPMCYNKYRK
jgi:hypothetical protein